MGDRHKDRHMSLRVADMRGEIDHLRENFADGENRHSFVRRGLRFALDHWQQWVKR